jgi:hypothetical protein
MSTGDDKDRGKRSHAREVARPRNGHDEQQSKLEATILKMAEEMKAMRVSIDALCARREEDRTLTLQVLNRIEGKVDAAFDNR